MLCLCHCIKARVNTCHISLLWHANFVKNNYRSVTTVIDKTRRPWIHINSCKHWIKNHFYLKILMTCIIQTALNLLQCSASIYPLIRSSNLDLVGHFCYNILLRAVLYYNFSNFLHCSEWFLIIKLAFILRKDTNGPQSSLLQTYIQWEWLSLDVLLCSKTTGNQLLQQIMVINPAVNYTFSLLNFSWLSTLSYSHTDALHMRNTEINDELAWHSLRETIHLWP